MNTNKTAVKVSYKTLVIIWAALLLSQVLFLVLIFLVKPELFTLDLTKPLFGAQPLVTLVFAFAAVTVFVLSFIFRNQHIKRAIVDQDTSCVQTGLVLACALSEVCSLLGVVLAFAFDYQYFFLWIGLGVLGILFHFPRKDALLAASYNK